MGRTRTLPGAGARQLTLGLVSCANYSVAPLTVYRALALREVDLVVHLGDYVYDSDGHSTRRAHEPPHPPRSLADYRTRIAQIRRDPDCQALHRRHPWATIVDDHDLADNAWRGGAKAHDEAEDGPWAARARAAMTARSEWLPSRRRDPGDVMATWRSLVIGDLAELILLDSRLHGRDEQAGMPGALPIDAAERSILGSDQRTWALERIEDVSRPWSLVANGVVVNEIVLRPPLARFFARLLPHDYEAYDGADPARRPVGRLPRRSRPSGGGAPPTGVRWRTHDPALRGRALLLGVRGPLRLDRDPGGGGGGDPVGVLRAAGPDPVADRLAPARRRGAAAGTRALRRRDESGLRPHRRDARPGGRRLELGRSVRSAGGPGGDCGALPGRGTLRLPHALAPRPRSRREPTRSAPPTELPARPGDVRAARRRHRLRRGAGVGAVVGGGLLAGAVLADHVRRRAG